MRRLRHELLAEVGPDEASGADHAYRHRLYRAPVQIYSRRRGRHSLSLRYDTVSIPSEEMQWRRIVVENFRVRSREYGREKEGSEFIERGSVKWERLRDRPRRSCRVWYTRGGIGRVGGCWCSILGLRTGDWHFV